MTTIAYRNGVMACDSRAYAGNSNPIGSKCKIERLEDGSQEWREYEVSVGIACNG